MYQFDSHIRYSEVDSESLLTWQALMTYFQDCSVFHSESINSSVAWLKEHHMCWVLSSWRIRVNRLPALAEKVTVRTWPYEMKGFYGLRNFDMLDADGNRLAYADTTWVFMDTDTMRPTRIPEEMAQAYGKNEQIEMPPAERRLRMAEEVTVKESITVPAFFIDTNHHMNNIRYMEVAAQYLPEHFVIEELRIEYKRAAVLGDVITPQVAEEKDGILVSLAAEDGKPYALLRFSGKTNNSK